MLCFFDPRFKVGSIPAVIGSSVTIFCRFPQRAHVVSQARFMVDLSYSEIAKASKCCAVGLSVNELHDTHHLR